MLVPGEPQEGLVQGPTEGAGPSRPVTVGQGRPLWRRLRRCRAVWSCWGRSRGWWAAQRFTLPGRRSLKWRAPGWYDISGWRPRCSESSGCERGGPEAQAAATSDGLPNRPAVQLPRSLRASRHEDLSGFGWSRWVPVPRPGGMPGGDELILAVMPTFNGQIRVVSFVSDMLFVSDHVSGAGHLE